MPRGRPPLDPEVRRKHRLESLKTYNEKNAAARREAARLRMQRTRAAIAAADHRTKREHAQKVADASERYRDKKRAEQRKERVAAQSLRRQTSMTEAHALHTKATAPVSIAPKKAIVPKLKKRGKAAQALPQRPLQEIAPLHPSKTLSSARFDDSSEDESSPPHQLPPIFDGMRTGVRPPVCAKCGEIDCNGGPLSGTSMTGAISSPPAPRAEGRTARDASALARKAQCSRSMVGICHEIDLPTYLRLAHGPIALLSRAISQGTRPTKDTRTRTSIEGFTPWCTRTGKGRTLILMLNRYLQARYFRAATWSHMLELWEIDCIDHHDHSGDHPGSAVGTAPPSPTPSSLSTLNSESSLSDYTVSCPPSPPTKLASKTPLIDGLKPDGIKFLAENRPAIASTSPRRMHEHLSRVLGLGAVGSVDEVAARMEALAVRDRAAQSPDMEPSALNSSTATEPRNLEQADHRPLFYAVRAPDGVYRRLFSSRGRAWTLLQATPGAELAFSHDSSELWRFLDETCKYGWFANAIEKLVFFDVVQGQIDVGGNEDGFVRHVAALPSSGGVVTVPCERGKKNSMDV
ncbi:hypothetical protein GGX14DRAFT_400505 [Mycena pura]|uniref:Uncharacterized protein n=1 Tax=Mycena pura TaxID=153505 RepID=A0AAD6V2J7_9AGAR|nr:hypothetical protein GGX14DRAFT_400505 [Mycena pura]